MRAERAVALSLLLVLAGLFSAAAPGQLPTSPAPLPLPGARTTLKLPGNTSTAGILPVDQAFKLTGLLWKEGEARIEWQIQPGYYLYQQKIALIAANGSKIIPQLPAGTPHKDEFEGDSPVYFDSLSFSTPLPPPAGDGKHHLTVLFQGCAQDRYCYPPVSREILLDPLQ